MARSPKTVASAFLTVTLFAALAFVVYLTYFLPKQVAVWEEAGQELPAGLVCLVKAGQCCQSCGLLLLPVLIIGAAVSAICWARAARG